MKKIGLFFGSFNPIHSGHLAVAEFFAQNTSLDEVWLVVSPQSPFKEKNTLMENHHRLAMAELAIEGSAKLKACAEEFDLPSPNYTINTLNHFKKNTPSINLPSLWAKTIWRISTGGKSTTKFWINFISLFIPDPNPTKYPQGF